MWVRLYFLGFECYYSYPMLQKTFCFLDIETTGTSPNFNRIIEIGIIKSNGTEIIDTFNTLVNPGVGLPPVIKEITGISASDLENAPTFYEISEKLREFLKDSILVAHNVRFDYGFLKNEFKRMDISFQMKHFCSIKLARTLFPGLSYYNLDSIIEKFNISCENRHRAFDDAKVIFDFYKKINESVSEKILTKAIDLALKKPSVPLGIDSRILDRLPESPGVYMFRGEDSYPIYIGKSVNVRERVLSHFSADHMSAKEMQISQEVKDIEVVKTAGELGALLLESTLVKKYKPLYNSMLREARKMILLLETQDKDGYSSVSYKEVDHIELEDLDSIIGIFKSFRQMKDHLYELSKQFFLCPKRLGLDNSKKFCFSYHLQKCYGACNKKELQIKYNVRFTEAFSKYKLKRWIFDSPVLIKEKGELEEAFIVDKWCLLGSIKSEEEFGDISQEYIFDLDTYKILTKFLSHPPKTVCISRLKV